MTLGRLALRCAAVATLAALAWPAFAQAPFPQRTVTLVVPFPPGSPVGVYAQVIAQQLAGKWTKGVIAENRPGASATIGTNAVAKATPDGYTLLFTIDLPITMAPAVLKSVPYKAEDLAPVGMVGETSNVLFTGPAVKAASVRELVDIAKAKPGVLTFASAGNGSPAHFAGELFKQAAGIDMVHVPYKGSALAMTDILNGTTSLMIGPIGQALPHVKRGAVAALGVTGPARSPCSRTSRRSPSSAIATCSSRPGTRCSRPPGLRRRPSLRSGPRSRPRWRTPRCGRRPAASPSTRAGPARRNSRAVKSDAARWANVAAAAKISVD